MSIITNLILQKNNSFFQNVVTELLINIVSFLQIEYKSICQTVCKIWLKNLKSNLSKKILLSIPKNMIYCESFDVKFVPKTIMMTNNHIYISRYLNACKLDMINSKLIEENDENFQTNIITSNNNYICTINLNIIHIYSLKMKLINKISTKGISDLVIDGNDNIIAIKDNQVLIYNTKGILTKSWPVVDYPEIKGDPERIACNDSEIFVLEPCMNRVYVFSYEGKLNRSWGGIGLKPGNLMDPISIAIYKNIVFISDVGHEGIQIFTCYGKYISQYKHKDMHHVSNIVIAHNYIYISNWGNKNIIKYRLIYD
jgi:hypothetical protein